MTVGAHRVTPPPRSEGILRCKSRHSTHPAQLPVFDTDGLRQHYLVDEILVPGEIRTVYTHEDRIVLGGATPLTGQGR